MNQAITSSNTETPALYIQGPEKSFGCKNPVGIKCCLRSTQASLLPKEYSDMVPRRNVREEQQMLTIKKCVGKMHDYKLLHCQTLPQPQLPWH